MGTNGRDLGPLALSVAAELRAEQGRQHVGVRALADRAGMPHSTLSKSLNGLRMIDVEELAKICSALSIEPAEIWRRAAAAVKPIAPVTPLRPNVGGYLDDAFKEQGYETAAGSDETQADEFDD